MNGSRVALLLLLVGCSRAPLHDDPPGSAASSGIPPAASGARAQLALDEASTDSPADGGGLVLPPGALGSAFWARPPRIRDRGATLSNGGLPPEVVQRIIRQSFGRFRLCYAHGLESNAALAGILRIRFVIHADGSAGAAADAGSSLPDKAVVECMRRSFEVLSFPAPTAGKLNVAYSLSFAPPERPSAPAAP